MAARRQAAMNARRHDVSRRVGRCARVLPSLARLAVDRSQGAARPGERRRVHGAARARDGGHARSADAQSQTSFGRGRGRRGGTRHAAHAQPAALTPEQVNALIGAAADPEPIVRAQAVQRAARRPGTAIASCRRSSRGSTTRRASCAHARPRRCWPSASRRTCPERPASCSRARRTSTRSRCRIFRTSPRITRRSVGCECGAESARQSASAALDRAISLDPRAARPLVIKGVIAARENRFTEAIDLWRKAKAARPGLSEYRSADCGSGEETRESRAVGLGLRSVSSGAWELGTRLALTWH